MPEDLGPMLRAAVQAVVGPLASVAALGRATQASVWLVSPESGPPVVLKRPHDAASFRAERDAYATWTPAVGRFAPRMLAVLAPPADAFVLQWVDGVEATDPALSESATLALHREAGRFCRAVADLPCPATDPMPLREALVARLAGWCRRAQGLLEPATLRAVSDAFDASLFAGVQRVYAHRDLSPWNWLATREPEPRLVVIDFGHARPDAPLTDLLKLWDRPWEEQPARRDAFFGGFGRRLTDLEEQRLRALALLHGVASAVWGREHDAPQYAATGDAVLRRLL